MESLVVGLVSQVLFFLMIRRPPRSRRTDSLCADAALVRLHLADRNAVGPKAERRADESGERRDTIPGPHRDEVGCGALEFARVLDQDDAVAAPGENRLHEIVEAHQNSPNSDRKSTRLNSSH